MHNSSVTVSAPGKLMLLGEHAVLHGRKALVCAVNRRLHVSVQRRNDNLIHIRSELGTLQCPLGAIVPAPPFTFVLQCLAAHRPRLDYGVDVRIHSEFPDTIGLGSSAAVTVALIKALSWIDGEDTDQDSLFARSCDIVRNVQGRASGADVAASVYGGLIGYRMDPMQVTSVFSEPLDLSVVYSGSKRKTPEVINLIEEKRRQLPELYDQIFQVMECSCDQAIQALRNRDTRTLGRILTLNQGLMTAIGATTPILSEIAHHLTADPGILGAKISGAGLGDSVVGLGTVEQAHFPYPVLSMCVEPVGVQVEPPQEQHLCRTNPG